MLLPWSRRPPVFMPAHGDPGLLLSDPTPPPIVISDAWARYVVLPWDARLVAERDWMSYAVHRLAAIYEPEDMSAFRVRLNRARYGHPRLAVALPETRLSMFDARGRGPGAAGTLTTHFCAALERLPRRYRAATVWLATVDATWQVLAHVHRHAVTWISAESVAPGSLHTALRRGSLHCRQRAEAMVLHEAEGHGQIGHDGFDGVPVHRITTFLARGNDANI